MAQNALRVQVGDETVAELQEPGHGVLAFLSVEPGLFGHPPGRGGVEAHDG
jgi:hypothetical protein